VSVAQHAENILAAWKLSDQVRLESEIRNAVLCCETRSNVSRFDSEQREVLQAVAEHFRSLQRDSRLFTAECRAGFVLLHHLADSKREALNSTVIPTKKGKLLKFGPKSAEKSYRGQIKP